MDGIGRCAEPARASFGRQRISLSWPIFQLEANREDVLDTILHEVAHALAGPQAGHGPAWKAMAVRVGARPVRGHALDTPDLPVVGACACGAGHRRTRMPKQGVAYRCRRCSMVITWERRTA